MGLAHLLSYRYYTKFRSTAENENPTLYLAQGLNRSLDASQAQFSFAYTTVAEGP